MEHTPENILLRAVRRGKTDGAIEAESRERKLEEKYRSIYSLIPAYGQRTSFQEEQHHVAETRDHRKM